MVKTILITLLTLSTSVFADKDITFFKNETLDSCYSKEMSPAVQNCMIYLSDEKKHEYEKAFTLLMVKAKVLENEFHNYDDVVKSLGSAKHHWEAYIEKECLAQAFLDEKESFAFYTDQHVCLIKAYDDRIRFYKNYQF